MDQHYLELQQQREAAIDAELASITDPEQRFVIGRFKGLGGSDMPKVMQISKFGTLFTLWKDKTERTYKEVDPLSTKGILFAFGHADEAVIADKYAKRTGHEVRKAGEVRMMNYPFLIGNFDRLICDPASPENAKRFLGGLECKTCENNSEVYDRLNNVWRNKWGVGNVYNGTELLTIDSDIDPEYYPQVQFYLMISNLAWWDVAVALGRSDIRFYRVFPNKEYQANLLERAVNFWCCNVLDHVAPVQTYEDAKTDTSIKQSLSIEASPEMREVAEKYKALDRKDKERALNKDELKNQLVRMLGKATKATYTNEEGKVKTLVSFSPAGTYSRLDEAALKNAHPEIYNQFKKMGNRARSLRIY